MKNHHNIQCPIPVQDWPNWANWLVTVQEGEVFAFSHEPTFSEKCNTWHCNLTARPEPTLGQRIGATGLKTVVPYYHIWKRPE